MAVATQVKLFGDLLGELMTTTQYNHITWTSCGHQMFSSRLIGLMRTSGYQVTHVTQSGHSPHMEEKWNRERNWYFFVFNISHSEWLAHPHNGDRLPAIGEQLENFIISFYDAIYLSRTLVKVISAVKLAESANDFCRLRQLFLRSSITSSYLRWQRIHPPSSSPLI